MIQEGPNGIAVSNPAVAGTITAGGFGAPDHTYDGWAYVVVQKVP